MTTSEVLSGILGHSCRAAKQTATALVEIHLQFFMSMQVCVHSIHLLTYHYTTQPPQTWNFLITRQHQLFCIFHPHRYLPLSQTLTSPTTFNSKVFLWHKKNKVKMYLGSSGRSTTSSSGLSNCSMSSCGNCGLIHQTYPKEQDITDCEIPEGLLRMCRRYSEMGGTYERQVRFVHILD